MNKAMFQYTVALGLCVLVLIVLGSLLTSEIQPTPGSSTPAVTASSPGEMSLELAHTVAAWIVGALTLGLAVWLRSGLAWAAFGIVVLEAWSGMASVLQSMPRTAGFLHALLAQGLLTIVVAAAASVYNSKEASGKLEDSGRLRALAISASHLAAIQVVLGAAYRHGVMGVLLHLLNALAVAIVVLLVCMFVMRQFPSEPSLRGPALALAVVTGVQVLLGFGDFTLLLIGSEGRALLILSVAHVSTGAVTMAASFLLATQVRRRVVRAST
jgi:heme A synthase